MHMQIDGATAGKSHAVTLAVYRYHSLRWESMKVAVASDHAGYPLKARIIEELGKLGHQTTDLGTDSTDPVDYPDYARAAAEAVLEGRADRAILLCGSGAGACVAANKFKGVRAATCHDPFSAHQSVEDDDVNVLCLGRA